MKTLPHAEIHPHPSGYGETSLTKREHFAAMAMQGWISATNIGDVPMDKVDNMPNIAAKWAVKYADALIEALNKEEQ